MALVEINNFDNHIYAVWFFCLKFCYKIIAFFMSINLYLSYFAQSWTVMSGSQTDMYWWQIGNFRRAAQNICGTSMLIDKIKNNGVASKHADGAWRCNIYIRNSRASPREYRILQTNFKNDDGQKLLISWPLKQKIVMFNFSTSRTFKKVLFSISFKRILYHACVWRIIYEVCAFSAIF